MDRRSETEADRSAGAQPVISRRTVLKGGALAGSALAIPVFTCDIRQPAIVVLDSSIPESVAFAETQNAARSVDLTSGGVRGVMTRGKPGHVTGLTRWSDWIALRGLLEGHGLRLTEETRVPGRLSGRDHLFRWTMTSR